MDPETEEKLISDVYDVYLSQHLKADDPRRQDDFLFLSDENENAEKIDGSYIMLRNEPGKTDLVNNYVLESWEAQSKQLPSRAVKALNNKYLAELKAQEANGSAIPVIVHVEMNKGKDKEENPFKKVSVHYDKPKAAKR